MKTQRVLTTVLATLAACATAVMLHSRVHPAGSPGLRYEPVYPLQYSLSYQP